MTRRPFPIVAKETWAQTPGRRMLLGELDREVRQVPGRIRAIPSSLLR
jgi:hypothetical protein